MTKSLVTTATAFLALVLSAFLGAQACGDGTEPATGDGDSDVDTDHEFALGEPCLSAERVGLFEISQHELYSAVTGSVSDGVNPTSVLFPADSEAGCELHQRFNPICDPPCEAGQVCTHDQECIPFPSKLDVGTVIVNGLTTDVTIEPNSVLDYQDTTVDHPPFVAGSEITLFASGNETESFALDGLGVDVLEVPNLEWLILADEALDISWTPANGDHRIMATFNVDQHGNSPMTMFCYFDDDGGATIPLTMVEALLNYGVTGYASGHLYRISYDSVQIDQGCVEMQTYSHVKTELAVDGHDPTTGP